MRKRRIRILILSSLLIIGGFFYFSAALAAVSDVVVTEIMYNPGGADTKHEWVELKNLGSDSVTVVGSSGAGSWRIFDGANHTLATSTVVSPGQYLIVAQDSATFLADYPNFSGLLVQSSALNLVNTSGTVALRLGSSSALWSEVNYFNTWGADGNGKTLEKINLSADNSAANWQESAAVGGTPGADNSTPSPPPPSPPPPPPPPPSTGESASIRLVVEEKPSYERNSIVINEWVSDPNDEEDEWVELYNLLFQSLDLTGWWLEDGSEAKTYLSGVIPTQGFLVIKNPKGRLNNSGEVITLKDFRGQMINQVIYGKWESGSVGNAPVADNGESVGRLIDGRLTGNDQKDFAVFSQPSPGAPNLPRENTPLSASVAAPPPPLPISGEVILHEFLANPSGSDEEGEFIELKNISSLVIDLRGFSLSSNGSNFTVTSSLILAPQGLAVLKRQQTRLVLKNSPPARLQLFNPRKVLIDEVSYDAAPENLSYGRCQATAGQSCRAGLATPWQWSTLPSPGQPNLFAPANHPPFLSVSAPQIAETGQAVIFDASDSLDPDGDLLTYHWSFGDRGTASGSLVSHIYKKPGSYRPKLEVSDGRGSPAIWRGSLTVEGEAEVTVSSTRRRSAVTSPVSLVQGTVTVPPGILGKQFFYLQNETSAYQIYSHKKLFPVLKIGDLVRVRGTLGSSNQIPRIKIKQAEDIVRLAGNQNIEPLLLSAAELSEDLLGQLVQLEGEAAEPKKQKFYLIDETGEVVVSYKPASGLKGAVIKEGDHLQVSGILTAVKEGWRLEPRQVSDLAVLAPAEEPESVGAAQNKKYLELTAGGLGSLLAGWLLRARGALLKTTLVGAIARLPWKKREQTEEDLPK